ERGHFERVVGNKCRLDEFRLHEPAENLVDDRTRTGARLNFDPEFLGDFEKLRGRFPAQILPGEFSNRVEHRDPFPGRSGTDRLPSDAPFSRGVHFTAYTHYEL